ncbi:MAG TPA: phage baseplate assembly protein V [Terriglobales bacterium]|nr:phage baseplate assembly protein V [Terriglobales bacterium]
MSQSVIDLLMPANRKDSGGMYGVVIGIVTNNQDPDKLGRVRVKFPWLSDDHESWWARIATPMAGSGRGLFYLPEVDDEVLVGFEHGDLRFPYVLGALWNGKDAPPETNSDGKNNLRVIHSRSGHLIRLDDSDGDEKVEIIDKTGNNSLTIKSSDNSFAITCNGKLTLHAANGIEINSDAGVKIQANANIDAQASGQVNVKGSLINLN